MFGVIVHLGDQSTPKLHLVGWCVKVLLKCIYKIFFPHNVISLVKCTSPSCTKSPQQPDAPTPILHCWDVLSLHPFNKLQPFTSTVRFIRSQDDYPCPLVQLQIVMRVFSVHIGAGVLLWIIMLSSWFRSASLRLVLGFICTFHNKAPSSLGHISHFLSEQYDASLAP